MLLEASTALLLPLYTKSSSSFSSSRFPVVGGTKHHHHRSDLSFIVRSGASSDGGENGARINDGYTRIPLETSDAYRLINDQTGENFIVWGDSNVDGTKDFSPPLPTQNPNRNPPSPSERPSAVTKSRLAAVIGGFGKLKAQKVRALVKSSSKSSSSSSSSSSDNRYKKNKSKQNYHDDDVADQTSNDSNFLHVIAKKSPPPSRTRLSDTPKVSTQNHPTRGWGSSAPAPYVGATDSVGFSKHQQLQPRQHKKINKNEDDSFFSRRSFIESGSSDYMVHALQSLQFFRPSNIQAMSYSTILQGKSCIIADQSGSGKTLAYLCPIIQCLREQELIGTGKSSPKNPRVVVLVPTAELANQVLSNCRSISKYGVPFRSMVATGGFRQKTQLESLQQELDILIATPGRFLYLLKEGFVELSNLKSVVLDEVDILFGDEEFDAVLKSLINSASMATQYLFVTATLPVDIYNKLVEVFPDCDVLMGPGMHRTSSGLEEVLVDCSGDGEDKNPDTAFLNKKDALLQLVEQSPVFKTIVFCNKIETCRKVENILKRVEKAHRIRALPFHSALEKESRVANMKEFHNPKSNDKLFLVCTDRASRGIDFSNVNHVVLFDYPRDPSEYVRRVGRTARGAGGTGRAFIFAVGKQVSLARRIIQRNQKGHPLHDVPSAYELESSIF